MAEEQDRQLKIEMDDYWNPATARIEIGGEPVICCGLDLRLRVHQLTGLRLFLAGGVEAGLCGRGKASLIGMALGLILLANLVLLEGWR